MPVVIWEIEQNICAFYILANRNKNLYNQDDMIPAVTVFALKSQQKFWTKLVKKIIIFVFIYRLLNLYQFIAVLIKYTSRPRYTFETDLKCLNFTIWNAVVADL